MKKRICKLVAISVEDQTSVLHDVFTDVNINSMYDVMQKVRFLETQFNLQFKRPITGFHVQIKRE